MASRGVNKVILIGHLGNDPEVKYMPSGGAVANISIATTERWKDRQSGEPQERTEWHRVVFYGRMAEVVGEYLRKGSQVFVEGRLQTRKWQAQDGQDRYTTEIVASDMQMLGGRGGAAGAAGGPGDHWEQGPDTDSRPSGRGRPEASPGGQGARSPASTSSFDDDDIPF